ncbi:MAG: ABC transporter substrate-binding protein [Rhodospirillaceae bacterium]|jgi:peptide/nickel transport system substrate-binding protein|nr:ABC transporter substrate-binding protein [Rhodospirillaceae bacterium]MBT6136554.1 ABC transporter substrate-binding protein [Rhodospirillaceae bacterium]
MTLKSPKLGTAMAFGAAIALSASVAVAETPQSGGVLNFVVGSKIPSYDGHIESTFGMIHPIRPFYSVLIRVNPDNPSSPTDFVCDLCVGGVPAPTEGSTKYTFKIRKGVKFHDGTPLTSADIKATFDKITFPPKGAVSNRKAYFKAVKEITAPDPETLVFKLKQPSGSFIPSVAMPFNFVYSKKDLDTHGYTWHQKNINGSGAFKFVEHKAGAYVQGERNKDYYVKGRPYLDGYKAISAPKMSIRLQAIRGDRAAIEFRGFPPKARDDLVKALGDKITVQESDWNCVLVVTPNHKVKPFDDPRVRRALSLAIDRWAGSKYLSKIAIVKTVAGVVFPGHPLAATEAELTKIAGFSKDIKASRAEARRLLKEAGHENLEFKFHNRGVDQPYKPVGTWLIGQWKKIGVKATQWVQPSTPFYATLRKQYNFDVSMDFNCQSIVNPIADISKFLPSAGNNYTQGEDATLEKWYDQLLKTADPKEQRIIIRKYEKRVMETMATQYPTLWWYKINPHRSYVKGWKIAPSHYLNQGLDNIWLDKSKM